MALTFPRYGRGLPTDAIRSTPEVSEVFLRNSAYRLAGFKPVPLGNWKREAKETTSQRVTKTLFENAGRADFERSGRVAQIVRQILLSDIV